MPLHRRSDHGCTNQPLPDTCVIDNVCYLGKALDPAGCLECNPALSQAAWSPVTNELPCDDGNGCTLEDHCQDGLCVGNQKDCGDGLDCSTDLCDPGTGECGYAVVEGYCLIGGACHADGEEKPGSAGCVECDPASAQTSWFPTNEGGECDDGGQCTHDDVCSQGVCAGTAYECNDDIQCTTDQCMGDGTCQHPVNDGFCLIDNLCHDAQALAPGGCLTCDPAATDSDWTPLPDSALCDDGDLCTLEDQCQQGICQTVPEIRAYILWCADGVHGGFAAGRAMRNTFLAVAQGGHDLSLPLRQIVDLLLGVEEVGGDADSAHPTKSARRHLDRPFAERRCAQALER